MSIHYMRSGNEQQYLHLSTCKRYGYLARLLGRVKRWTWAGQQDRAMLMRLTQAMGIKHCRVCQPFGLRAANRRSPR